MGDSQEVMGESCGGRQLTGKSRYRWRGTVLKKCKSASDMVLEDGSKEQKSLEERYQVALPK